MEKTVCRPWYMSGYCERVLKAPQIYAGIALERCVNLNRRDGGHEKVTKYALCNFT